MKDEIMNNSHQGNSLNKPKLNEEIENFKNYIIQQLGDLGSVHFLEE